MLGNDLYQVKLDGETGSLSVNLAAAFAVALDEVLELTLRVRDMHLDSKTDTAIISIRINP